jgi:hypothetical protein
MGGEHLGIANFVQTYADPQPLICGYMMTFTWIHGHMHAHTKLYMHVDTWPDAPGYMVHVCGYTATCMSIHGHMYIVQGYVHMDTCPHAREIPGQCTRMHAI